MTNTNPYESPTPLQEPRATSPSKPASRSLGVLVFETLFVIGVLIVISLVGGLIVFAIAGFLDFLT